uniref:Uncharacterized protein n=1 Tax=Arundo donax TaxID=35708 RepID=A0A0A9HF68_ARUDO
MHYRHPHYYINNLGNNEACMR